MKVDSHLTPDWYQIPDHVKKLEAEGYDGTGTAEMNHDPFFPLMLAAEHSEKIELHTGIAVALARSPMILANLGHDLNAYSKGRFTMGLGSQIRTHITKRFSMPWGAPARQMRELILAMRAIWYSWYEGEPLRFEGEYYNHTLMTPAFTPDNKEHGAPRVTLAAVGPIMTRIAGEVADGLIIHPFSNEKYIREVTLPAVEEGLSRSGRSMDEFEISYTPFLISGKDEETFDANKLATKRRIAFYGSTPAYKQVLGVHGWGDLQPELNTMSKKGKWQEMGELITDDMLDTFGIMGEPDSLVSEIVNRYSDFTDRINGSFSFVDTDTRLDMAAKLRAV
ncbi:MAG: TIGR03617 family F420-dependent LLM class oxidoreductase [Pseudomonadales bacterium]|jgi:probable F420-dependent oxidoreductase|nr:LLM class F420-dependent oxidoreductase [Gammaproteobacteria bacterium]MDP6025189.1 TIGR03617 family F420-dependent LLM class oxidoreductase [Pseudomonadales bacterium]MDP6314752.1 TIGR03617 family F420-dependent LLM class oxidoreductase [Pseudomonadales bacterium]MDP7314169.1 TIGR03617 family F420-dependent LLM class oxidoreductase [Pseudomonadales bacterium]MDP7575996.1 TIGR03617 family F420-dependent LLM class oxidoreductase [Pseudomonadales bacterium]|tara:strand:- start:350 stop:1357 length:1008 start_codon:yes stop_codon:yes gene_type:complete